MIKFKEIFFENFLSFYGEHHYKFESNGIHWISGLNLDEDDTNVSIGSGKTSFTFVIQYALFGQIEKKLSKKDKIINKIAGKNLLVKLLFEVDDKLYKISRYRKHNEFDNDIKFEMYSNDTWIDLTSTSAEATQKQINDIISISPETFLKIILYSREDDKHFFKLTNSERIKIFENIIQLNKFNKYQKNIKNKIKNNEEELIAKEKEEYSIEKVIKVYEQNAKDEKTQIDKEIKLINSHLKKLKSLNTNYDINKFEELKYKLKLTKILKKDIENETIIIPKTDQVENKIYALINKKDKINTKTKNLKPITCENCGSVQNEKEYKSILASYDTELLEIENEIEEYNNELNLIKEMIPKQQEKKEEQEKKLIEIKNEIKELNNQLEENFNDLLNMSDDEIQELQVKQDLINQYERDLERINYNKVDEFIEKANIETNKLNKIKEEKKQLIKTKKMLSWWNEALDMKNENSIKSYIISQVIPVFNNILKNNLNLIFDGKLEIYIDQQLNEKVIKDGQEYDYFELSSGEKFKVNFCTNFSIFDMTKINISSSNLIFFDDVFINIDLPTTLKFLNLIENKYSKDSAIYLISHDKNVENNINPLSKTIIKKKDSKSYIEKNPQ